MMARRDPDSGVVLINVLVILALMGSVVFAMLSLSEVSIARSQRFSDAVQAAALIAAGEASAIVALRRDMEDAPDSDHLKEAWSSIGQDEVEIEGGRFALTIADAQAKFNLNSLPESGALGAQILQRIVETLELHPDVGLRIAARLAQPAPLQSLAGLISESGLGAAEVGRLATLVDVLPGKTDININTAPPALVDVLTDDPLQTRRLVSIRDRKESLSPEDVAAAGVILPPGTAYASAFFDVTVTVTVGAIRLVQTSRLQRRTDADGLAEVVVVGRDAGPVVPPGPVPQGQAASQ